MRDYFKIALSVNDDVEILSSLFLGVTGKIIELSETGAIVQYCSDFNQKYYNAHVVPSLLKKIEV